MIGLCNIPPGSPLFGVDVFSARPRFDWDKVPSSSICERFEQRSCIKSPRKMLRYLKDGRKVWGERVTHHSQPQSSDQCWKQTLSRFRLIVHTSRELLFARREQQPSPPIHLKPSLLNGWLSAQKCSSKTTSSAKVTLKNVLGKNDDGIH
uniref:Uncharacterized protein n=1 Tax=Globodera rostochiensis TaxID=31243 RepID=A0A914HGR9_GLORO